MIKSCYNAFRKPTLLFSHNELKFSFNYTYTHSLDNIFEGESLSILIDLL